MEREFSQRSFIAPILFRLDNGLKAATALNIHRYLCAFDEWIRSGCLFPPSIVLILFTCCIHRTDSEKSRLDFSLSASKQIR